MVAVSEIPTPVVSYTQKLLALRAALKRMHPKVKQDICFADSSISIKIDGAAGVQIAEMYNIAKSFGYYVWIKPATDSKISVEFSIYQYINR